MKRNIGIFLPLIFMFCSCSVLVFPLKKVKKIDTNNNLLLKYAENYKFLGKSKVNFQTELTDGQKRYLNDPIEKYSVQRGFVGYQKLRSYKDYKFNRSSFNDFIIKNVFWLDKEFQAKYLKIFNETVEEYFAYNYFIRRQTHGLATYDVVVSIIEFKGESKLAIIGRYPRHELDESIKNELFTLPFIIYTEALVDSDIDAYLKEYCEIDIQFKKHKSIKKYEEDFNSLQHKYKFRVQN